MTTAETGAAPSAPVNEGLDINQIKKLLPHRYPFLLVDRVTSYEPGTSAKGYKNLTANEPFFEGHFPFRPIMPGVLMVEALAQLGCIAILTKGGYENSLGVFTGIDGFKFRAMVQPGDRLDMEVELIKMKGPLGKLKATARVGDKLACEGEISFSILETEKVFGK
jgi:3-hydroxyacyl-[acyl-carrier-protein] dehydratase